MVEPATVEDLEQSIRDAQDKFNAGMGADGDASPYPLLKELRAQSPVHAGWPEMGMAGNSGDGAPTFTAYTFDAVKAIFTDNITFSTRCYEDVVRPLQGPTILEMQEPEHAVYRKLHEFAFARSSMKRWDAELVGPLVDSTIAKFKRRQARGSGRRRVHADPGAGDRRSARASGFRCAAVPQARHRPAWASALTWTARCAPRQR